MKPIRVKHINAGEGTWIDTVVGPVFTYAVVVWDDGSVLVVPVEDIHVINVGSVKLRAL